MLEEALNDVDLVVHAAGPFQRENECTVLQAAIATKTAYIDICDDTDYSWRAKGFHEQAKACGVPAITTAGIYPGVDLDCSNGRNTIRSFSHKKLSVSVGYATAAFVLAVLEGSTQPGVWFPEEPDGIAIESRKVLLERASQGTTNFVMNK
uniref:Saccharopine dehydrogenase NADP binding domain-containing protein n=1 Tax=Oryza brachyantha TaxID=4533 RepID=J3KUV5_ORYBR